MRLPTGLRIALLAMLLVLLSNVAVIGFIHYRTYDDALGALARRAGGQARVLADVERSGGPRALRSAIDDALADDDEAVIAMLDARGRPRAGNLARALEAPPRAGFRVAPVMLTGETRAQEAGLVLRALGPGRWLASGSLLDERVSQERALQRALLLAIALALLFGIGSGLALARYVSRRVRAVAAVVDAVGEGDLALRAPAGTSGDAFDLLAGRINHMLDRLVALMDELRLLGDTLGHDLRSPLGRLRARVEQAIASKDAPARATLLAGMLREIDALLHMISTVLEIGRSEAMTARRSFVALDPAILVAELAEMYEPLAEERGLALSWHAAPGLAIEGHRQLLAQAISNLVDNAVTHGRASGATSLHLFAEAVGTEVRIGIADNGGGIAEADRATALKRFGRLDAARTQPGAGLGLALVTAVAHLHGGRFALDDAAPGLRAALALPASRRRDEGG